MIEFNFSESGNPDVVRTQLRSAIIDSELAIIDRKFLQHFNMATERMIVGMTIEGDVTITCNCTVFPNESYHVTFNVEKVPLNE